MKKFTSTMLITFAGFMLFYALGAFIGSSRFLARSSEFYRRWATEQTPLTAEEYQNLRNAAESRVRLYLALVKRDHLEKGMIVNRDRNGQMKDQCDSLLFSSIWAVSLHQLGMENERDSAWDAIAKSRIGNSWARHPTCPKSTSRDMLLGLLMAISTRPKGYDATLDHLVAAADAQDGFFADGPVYVSYMSPGLARMIHLLYGRDQLARSEELPPLIRDSYSTAEVEVIVTDDGYASHLGALTAWLEIELEQSHTPTASFTSTLERLEAELIQPFSTAPPSKQRLEWITEQLVRTDPTNMFYRYLRLKTAGALNQTTKSLLLKELLQMPQFPNYRLPMNCDRKADYLWQRSADERRPSQNPNCTIHFSGVDFLWMASLLLEHK